MDSNNNSITVQYCHSTEDIVDCQLMHIKDICATGGLKLSGAMCFGLSEAYDFSYWIDRSSKIPCLVMLGRKKYVLETFLEKMSVSYKIRNINSESEFESHVIEETFNGNIVLAYVDRYYLNYLEKKYNRAHFGNHMIAISGYTKTNNNAIKYAINDVVSDDICWCNSAEIQTARLSSWKPFSPNGEVVDIFINGIELQQFEVLLPQMIICSINNTINNMLDKERSGVNAIRSLALEIKSLLNINFKKYHRAISFQMKLIASFIKEFEETHSFYRKVFSDFLLEAVEKYGLTFLADYVPRMKDIAEQWICMSELINNDNIPLVLLELSEKLFELSDMEKIYFEDLQQLIRNRQSSI